MASLRHSQLLAENFWIRDHPRLKKRNTPPIAQTSIKTPKNDGTFNRSNVPYL